MVGPEIRPMRGYTRCSEIFLESPSEKNLGEIAADFPFLNDHKNEGCIAIHIGKIFEL